MSVETSDIGKRLGLIRGFGVWAATAIVIGAMIGQSVFLLWTGTSPE